MTYRSRYRSVDRSDFTPNFDGRMGDEVFDIGWAEGVLQDGRPYRMECWGLAGRTGVTVFMVSETLEDADAAQVHALLEASGVITTLIPQELSLLHFVDPAGTPCMSISYVVADEDDEYFIEAHPPLTSYHGGQVTFDPVDEQALADAIEAIDAFDALLRATVPKRSAQAEARRAAKALAKQQPKKKRAKRRRFRKG